MRRLAIIIYNVVMQVAAWGEGIYSLFNKKAKRRRQVISQQYGDTEKQSIPTILFHCASLGEYLQARPLMELVRRDFHHMKIVVSFFSASGYDQVSTDEVVSATYFLPVDTKRNVEQFMRSVSPKYVVLVKYEIWLNFIQACTAANIPIYLISARFHPKHFYFSRWGIAFIDALRNIDRIFAQDVSSIDILDQNDIAAFLSGDTRADQVLTNIIKQEQHAWMRDWKSDKPLLVCGSIWPQDLQCLQPALTGLSNEYKVIIAPHEIDEAFLSEIEHTLKTSVTRWTKIGDWDKASDVILLDVVGELAHIYRYADVAYIGGAFKQGLHNIFEPAVWGIPVLFGPEIERFPEALALVEQGGAISIKSPEEIKKLLGTFVHRENRTAAGKAARDFIEEQAGGTNRIFNKMKEDGWFINHEE